jgi:hypothetical protein
MILSIATLLDAAGQYYTLTPSAQAVLNELIDGEKKRRDGIFTKIWYGKLHFQRKTKYSAEAIEDAWKLLLKKKMINIIPRPGCTHVFEINSLVYDFCTQLRFLNFHISPKKYLKEVMEGLADNPLFLVHKYNAYNRRKTKKVPPSNPQKVPPIRTSSLVGLRSRVRIRIRAPDSESKRVPEIPKILPIVRSFSFFNDYEKYRISQDFEYVDILAAKQDMDNYQYKFLKTIDSEAAYFINALNRQKKRRMSYAI